MNNSRVLQTVAAAALMIALLPSAVVRAQFGSTGIITYKGQNDVVDGSTVEISLCFGEPVDHQRSVLALRSGQGIRRLRPRLESATDCLFSIAGRLAPGNYDLVWAARLSDGQTQGGTIPFLVKLPLVATPDSHRFYTNLHR